MKFYINKLIFFLVILLFLLISFYSEILAPTKLAKNYKIKYAVSNILFAKAIGEINGSYWENELSKQFLLLGSLSLIERLNFFALVLMNCNLDTSSAFLFYEMVGKDAAELNKYLTNLKNSEDFNNLNISQQLNIIKWLKTEI